MRRPQQQNGSRGLPLRRRVHLALLVAVGACTGPLAELRPIPASNVKVVDVCDPAPAPCALDVTFTYLGVGGFIIRAGNDAVMTSPSFTHPGIVRVSTPFLGFVSSDSGEVERQLHRLLGDSLDADLARVRGVLVGHSHYDHAMDLPTVMRTHLQAARVIGGMTTKRILVGDAWMDAHRSQIDSIPLDSTGTPSRPGQWVTLPGKRIRVMALRSSHAPNVAKFTIAKGTQDADRHQSLPRTAFGWLLGDPYAYLIDVLDATGRPAFRILYQDAAVNPADAVLPPFLPADQHPLDVAIICAGNFENVESYPMIVATANRPKVMIVGHWEDFFHSMDDALSPIRFTDTKELRERLDMTMPGRWFTPEPGGRIQVRASVPPSDP